MYSIGEKNTVYNRKYNILQKKTVRGLKKRGNVVLKENERNKFKVEQ